IALLVGRDVELVEVDLAAFDGGVAVGELRLALAQRLHLGPGQGKPRLQRLLDEVVVQRLAVGRDGEVLLRVLRRVAARTRGASMRLAHVWERQPSGAAFERAPKPETWCGRGELNPHEVALTGT